MAQIRLNIERRVGWLQVARPALVIAAIVLSGALAIPISAGLDPTYLLGALVGLIAASVVIRLRRFEYGLLAVLLAAGLINFFSLPTGRDSRVVISLFISLMLLMTWAFQLVYSRVTGARVRPSPINMPLLAFVLINIVAYMWSQLLRDPLLRIWPSFPVVQLAALMVNIALPLMTLLTANKFRDEKWLRAMMGIIIMLGFIVVAVRIPDLPIVTMIDNGSKGVFPAWAAVTAYALALFNRNLKTWQRAALLLLTALLVYLYFFQTRLWVTGWLPMFFGITVVTFFYSRRLFALACAIGVIVIALNYANLYESIFAANVDEGGLERFDLWSVALSHVANHPLLGMGPAGYAAYYMTYNPLNARSTHNNYFDVVAQNGIIGLVSFVILIVVFVRIALATRKATAGRFDSMEAFACAALGGLVAAVVSMMLGDWVLPFAYNQTITGFDNAIFTWMMLGGMVSLYHLTHPETHTQTALPQVTRHP